MDFDATPARIPFPPGRSPFRANGIVFRAAMAYASKRTPGGPSALRPSLAPADADYLAQIFLPGTMYDLAPLVRLAIAAAALEGVTVADFTRARARESADMDIRGIYRLMLKVTSPQTLAARLPWAFNRYFAPTRAEINHLESGRLTAILHAVPAPMAGWYVSSTEGFVGRALELAGASPPAVRFTWASARAEGAEQGVPLVTLPFAVAWR